LKRPRYFASSIATYRVCRIRTLAMEKRPNRTSSIDATDVITVLSNTYVNVNSSHEKPLWVASRSTA